MPGVSRTIRDGLPVPGATVTVTQGGKKLVTVTDSQGFYSFPSVPVGMYNLAIRLDGFKPMTRTGLGVDADSRLQVDVTLEIGEQSETVNVSADQIHIETVSTQLGEVVSSAKMTTLSLNGRSYTDLLAIQPGVTPVGMSRRCPIRAPRSAPSSRPGPLSSPTRSYR